MKTLLIPGRERERKSFLNFAGERRKKSLLLRREMMMMISSTTLTTAPKSVQRVPKKVRRHHLCVFLPIVLVFEFFFASKTGVFSVQSRVSGSDFKRSAISFSCISLSLSLIGRTMGTERHPMKMKKRFSNWS